MSLIKKLRKNLGPMRYFIALDFPKKIKDELLHLQQKLKKTKSFSGKFVEYENLHLTLRFLSELTEHEAIQIQTALEGIKFDSFDISLGLLDLFSLQQPRILWVDLTSENLILLQKEIEETVSQFIPPERKSFVAHVTLARIKEVLDSEKLLEVVKNTKPQKLSFHVDRFVLKESELTTEGPIYTDTQCYLAQNSKQ
jgi:RNA 2',3'-cyclic 3'-phosphodiesterase